MRSVLRALLAAGLGAGLAGCVVGPDYHGPPKVAESALHRPAFLRAGGDASTAPPPAAWWRALSDGELDRLEDTALADAPVLAIAEARLRQSRAGLSVMRADQLPRSGLAGAVVRTNAASSLLRGELGTGAPPAGPLGTAEAEEAVVFDRPLDFYDVGFDSIWEIDLFGGRLRAVEAAGAGAQAAQADLQDVDVSLTAEVAQAYVQARSLQARLALIRRATELQTRLLTLMQARRAGGVASELDVERLLQQRDLTASNLQPLQSELVEQTDRLAALLGQPAGSLDEELARPALVPLPPVQVAVGDPADLLRRRPDVRAAERRIQQRNALIGQRTAELFPKVTLLGEVGLGSTGLSGLLQGASLAYTVAPVLRWSPLDFGRTRSRIVEASAAHDEALAEYRRTVLQALQEAETALSRFGRGRETLAALRRVQASAERSAELTRLSLQGGEATSLDILDAEERRVRAETDVAEACAALTQDFIALQKSLGLGWRPAFESWRGR